MQQGKLQLHAKYFFPVKVYHTVYHECTTTGTQRACVISILGDTVNSNSPEQFDASWPCFKQGVRLDDLATHLFYVLLKHAIFQEVE